MSGLSDLIEEIKINKEYVFHISQSDGGIRATTTEEIRNHPIYNPYTSLETVQPAKFFDTRPKEEQEASINQWQHNVKTSALLSAVRLLVSKIQNDEELGKAVRQLIEESK